MIERGDAASGRSVGSTTRWARSERLRRPSGRTLLAVGLTIVMVLSLFAVPVAGAPPKDAGPPNGNGNSGGGNGNKGAGNGGGSDAGSNSGGNSDNGGNGNSGGAKSAGKDNGGGGGDGAGHDTGNSDPASDGKGNSNGVGSSGDTGPPDDPGPPGGAGSPGDAGQSGEAGPPADAGSPDRGGPTVSVSTGPPGDSGEGRPPDAPPGQSDGGQPSSVVDVTVQGAEAGDDVSIDVSPASVEDEAVAFEGISVRVKRGGDFTMQVTNSREALPGSPDFEPPAAAESLGRVRLEHSISNDEVEDVSFTFRVSKVRLESTDTDPETVTLYRYSEGGWTALSTDAVGETDSHYVFQADSPGMSEFAIGAQRPEFDTYWADAVQASADPGEAVTVSGRVTNVGAADGVYEASLTVDGEVVSTRTITIAAGGTRQVNFRTDFERSGTYAVAVDDVSAGSVTVEARSAESDGESLNRVAPVSFQRLMDLGRALSTTVVSMASGI